jgi:hypothetical protein
LSIERLAGLFTASAIASASMKSLWLWCKYSGTVVFPEAAAGWGARGAALRIRLQAGISMVR